MTSSTGTSSDGVKVIFESSGVRIHGEPVGPLSMNQYLVACLKTKKAAIVDSGDPDPTRFLDTAKSCGYTIEKLLQTHAHIDHVMGLAETKRRLPDADVYLHPKDAVWYENTAEQSRRFGFSIEQPDPWDVDLSDNDVVDVGDLSFRVLETPGHAPGHVCFYNDTEDVLFVGDLIFQGSIGRTDLPFCDQNDMVQSLRRVMALPKETKLYPGHMGPTTMATELSSNPFLLQIKSQL